MQRTNSSERFPIGSKLPAFSLKNIDGSIVGADYLGAGKAGLVVFTCNHCPYVKGTEAMLIEIARRFAGNGLRTVTINSNDPLTYPDDSFENMQRKAADLRLPYPYLWDENQVVAKLFDAACTPECYLFDRNQTLAFHGAITDNPKDPAAPRTDYLSPVIEAVLHGAAPSTQFVHPLGCSIKWKAS
jgi:thiol-disulfide isomerase/thioredoxin